ncbi:DUF742 domain-containing protein [Lipingzhangella sp. LS1_29]|uniref:DUF742 domain-containing protein n=1 Tax=Lipingzhangella rawalii TaxID=2055835 RepID=A0ABU2H4H4_9ACTN|nr:DUF742 domain-containing protein [Lipingzhangella rawalii]MDS1270202.1 DUF742 domain-containing protein [Lipingzhangella rawalii]
MTQRDVDSEAPDRLFLITGGRHQAQDNEIDPVALVVSECEPSANMQSEHAQILRICRHPTAAVELSADLNLPVSVTRLLLRDLLDRGAITVRHPPVGTANAGQAPHPAPETLKQVLDALQRL